MTTSVERAAEALRHAKRGVAVTGAGMSAESGIPTFRGADGIWKKYPPEIFASIDAYLRDPDRVWAFWCELSASLHGCNPNAGHSALAQLESSGKIQAIITQNIDSLHQAAGSRRVIEYHGSLRELVCLECRARKTFDVTTTGKHPPHCVLCQGLMKPDVVMFGEGIPPDAMYESEALIQVCDVLVVVGTSAQVYPAAGLPFAAKRNGALIIEANLEPTEFTETVTDVFLEGPCGQTLPRVAALMH
ncbi:MAG: NAD-dependent deacylase [Candidatus Hydrogenedentes bacterium]|nr:NAD-dependent deacylase [Candidatus Hydrogenedentota bacterium]